MTNTTTALQALVKAATRVRAYVHDEATDEERTSFINALEAARDALAAPAPALHPPADDQIIRLALGLYPDEQTYPGHADDIAEGANLELSGPDLIRLVHACLNWAAPAPALDAPAALVEDCTVYVLNSRGTNRWWATVQGGHDDKGRRIEDDECRQIAQALAARASQPTPAPALDAPAESEAEAFDRFTEALPALLLADRAGVRNMGRGDWQLWEAWNAGKSFAARASKPTPAQDAAATVQVPREVLQKLADEANSNAPSMTHTAAVEWAEAALAATSPAPQVAPTAAQPVAYHLVNPEGLAEATERSAIMAWVRLTGTYKTTLESLLGYEQQGWRVVAAAPTTPQAPALVPLTDDPIRALLEKHRALLDDSEYTYFELAYTRQTGFMAWLTDKPLASVVVNPDRKVIVSGQGDTADAACADALQKLGTTPKEPQ